jgi:hypothetical protein
MKKKMAATWNVESYEETKTWDPAGFCAGFPCKMTR